MDDRECFRCARKLTDMAGYHRLRIGLDLAPSFDALPAEHQSTVEEESEFIVCVRCMPDVSTRVDELLSWLWSERPDLSNTTGASDAARREVIQQAAQAGALGAS